MQPRPRKAGAAFLIKGNRAGRSEYFPTMPNTSKILLPLDFPSADAALAMAAQTHNDVAGFKIGLELVNAAGFDIFARLQDQVGPETRIFYDCKFHDIPNTVAGAVRAASRRNVWMLNVHAVGGGEMMRAACRAAGEGADAAHAACPLVVAVTVLTSTHAHALQTEMGVSQPLDQYVVHLARLAQDSGCDGVVASPLETASIRAACGPDFLIVTPGVRPLGADAGDQKRIMTPGEAVRAGADYLVVGRPITSAPDPGEAARAINRDAGNLA